MFFKDRFIPIVRDAAIKKYGNAANAKQEAALTTMEYTYYLLISSGKKIPGDELIVSSCKKLQVGDSVTKELLLSAAVDRNEGDAARLWAEISARLSSSQPPAPTETRPLDPDLLIESIKLAQMFADISDEETSPERSARIISLLYETQLENRNITRSQLLKLVVNNT